MALGISFRIGLERFIFRLDRGAVGHAERIGHRANLRGKIMSYGSNF
jgi:hypothetical protein